MAPLPGMETVAARLASFERTVPVPKRRGSNAKGQKMISWPHRNPSPKELAEAGLYYNPSSSTPDNTTCFLCERQLAGWEDDDEPVTEHLKLSSHCGWAIIKSITHDGNDISTMEDPTNERLHEARRSTFRSLWPHEHKRGWVCKTEKMAAAGWYFAPTPECEDFVSCAYCNLSLDGWEPKDSPFDEHYRRSPGCAFFAFAGTAAPKGRGRRKTRASKDSRLSTQSNATAASQAQSIPELNDSIDGSNISQDTVLSTTSTMASKKAGKGKGRPTRGNKAEPVGLVNAGDSAAESEVPEQPDTLRQAIKRKSDDISESRRGERESTVKPEPPPKRRATRSRNSETQQIEYPVLDAAEAAPSQPMGNGRKRASSRSRKTSTASVATTASLRAVVPNDAEIDAALEADLDKPIPNNISGEAEAVGEPPQPKIRGRAKKTNASTAPTRSKRQATADLENHSDQAAEPEARQSTATAGTEAKVASKGKGRKPRVTKKPAHKPTARTGRPSDESTVAIVTRPDCQLNSSLLMAQTIADDSGQESDASFASQKPASKKGAKRRTNAKSKGKKIGLASKNVENLLQTEKHFHETAGPAPKGQADPSFVVVEPEPSDNNDAEEQTRVDNPRRVTRATKHGRPSSDATTKAKTKFPQLSMPGMFSPLMNDGEPSFNSVLATSSPPLATTTRSALTADQSVPDSLTRLSSSKVAEDLDNRTPMPVASVSSPVSRQDATLHGRKNTNEATPSPSPQSSDAENQPPSSRPPSVRPPVPPLSPTKDPLQCIPLTLGTPREVPLSPSKIGGLKSELPWTAVDVEMVFAPSPGKENVDAFAGVQKTELTSPEKTMSVESWIKSRATLAEETLKAEAERVVSIFEREGGRALRVLEGLDVL